MHKPLHFTEYTVGYGVMGRLTRLGDGKVLWQDTCQASLPKDKAPIPTMDELEAKNAELLKSLLNKESKLCAKQLLANFMAGG